MEPGSCRAETEGGLRSLGGPHHIVSAALSQRSRGGRGRGLMRWSLPPSRWSRMVGLQRVGGLCSHRCPASAIAPWPVTNSRKWSSSPVPAELSPTCTVGLPYPPLLYHRPHRALEPGGPRRQTSVTNCSGAFVSLLTEDQEWQPQCVEGSLWPS